MKHPILCREKHPTHPERSGYRCLNKTKLTKVTTPKEPDKPVVPILGQLTEIKGDFDD